MVSNLQRTPGFTEGRLAAETGLRRRDYLATVKTATGAIVAAHAPTKDAVTAATIVNGRICYPSTLCVTVNQTAGATTGTVQVTIKGIDLFGNAAVEVTPTISIAGTTQFDHIYCAQVFATVLSVDYLVTGLGTTQLSVGVRYDWIRTEDASNHHQYGRNLGIGIPMQLRTRPIGAATANRPRDDLGIPPAPTQAFGTLTLALNPANAETVTIDGVVYTWKTGALTTAYDVKVGADATASGLNLQGAINLTGTAGTDYHASTARHPTAYCQSALAGVLTVRARQFGAEGNFLATTETMAGAGNQWGATTMGQGQGDTGELVGVTWQTWETGGSMVVVPSTNILVGYNESGWAGSIEKLGFVNSAAIGTYATGDTGTVTMSILTREQTQR